MSQSEIERLLGQSFLRLYGDNTKNKSEEKKKVEDEIDSNYASFEDQFFNEPESFIPVKEKKKRKHRDKSNPEVLNESDNKNKHKKKKHDLVETKLSPEVSINLID